MNEEEKDKLSYEAVLRELHHLDNLVEKHSQLAIAISGAVFGFAATRLDNHAVVYLAAAFGIATAIEWFFKIFRHRQIFLEAHKKLVDVEQRLVLNVRAARSFSKFPPNGFTILLCFALLLILFWLFLCIGVGSGLFAETHSSASQVVEAVTKELPTVTGIRPLKWTFTSMSWDDASQSYGLIVDSDNPATTWLVTYDTRNRRIAKSTLKREGPNQPPSTFFGISEVQRRLLDLGYRPGPVDGIMGRNTINAVKRFQIDHSLQATGGLDKETIEKLGFSRAVTK